MHLVHLTASTFFGGPERQMLGLAGHLPAGFAASVRLFPEGGRYGPFAEAAAAAGFPVAALSSDSPRVSRCVAELASDLRRVRADVLLCHGYKANVLGRVAARRVGIPAVAVSRGWTGENLKVRAYETLDRVHLKYMDHVVAVSAGQAAKVRRTGVPAAKLSVIRNAARPAAFAVPNVAFRDSLRKLASGAGKIVVAAGRLSPEKGFDVLVEAAPAVFAADPDAAIVLFGEGPERPRLEARVRELGIAEKFVMPGLTADLDQFWPWATLAVLPSFTEGLPNVLLEASAAGVAVVATAVGGTPEVVADGETGLLVPPGRPIELATAVGKLLADGELRARLGADGRSRMNSQFSFAAQADAYVKLFARLLPARRAAA